MEEFKLFEYQEQVLISLKNEISKNTRNIALKGCHSVGKSTIAFSLEKKLKNTYDILNINGCGESLEDYSTLFSIPALQKPHAILSSISTKLNFFKIDGTTLTFREALNQFNSKEYSFISHLNKHYKKKNLIIIARNYEKWDTRSKRLLDTISQNPSILKNKKVQFILTYNENEDLIESNFDRIINVRKPSLSDMDDIAEKLNYSFLIPEESKMIHTLSGGNINLIIELIKNTSTLSGVENLRNYADNRLKHLQENNDNIFKLLTIASIYKTPFNYDDISELLEQQMKENLKEELKFAVDNTFIEDLPPYGFTNDLFIKSFNEKLFDRDIYYKRKYENFSRKNPQKYLDRHIHYIEYKSDDLEELSLLFLAYVRAKESGSEETAKEQKLKIFAFNKSGADMASYYEAICIFMEGVDLYFKHKFSDAIKKFNMRTLSESTLVNSEVTRLQLICQCESDLNTLAIEQLVMKLNSILVDLESKSEFEVYFKIQSLLFSVYPDKLNKLDESIQIKAIMEKMSNNSNVYISSNATYLKHVFIRKSAIISPFNGLADLISSSIRYFEDWGDCLEAYKAKCNYASAKLVIGEFEFTRKFLEDTLAEIKDDNINISNIEKFKVNYILSRIFIALEKKKYDFTDYITEFKELLNAKSNETIAIVHINLISLYLLNSEIEKAKKLLAELNNYVLEDNEDNFYKYYIDNFNVIFAVLNKQWNEAKDIVNSMETPTLYLQSATIFEKRKKCLLNIIDEQYNSQNILDYSKHFAKVKLNNQGWEFFGNMFMFSDLMFLSN